MLGEEEKALVWSAMETGQLAQGARVAEFEKRFAEFVGAPHAVAVSSGTTAIHLALLAAGIGEGDEVITVSFTFTASASAVLHAGARPVFIDVDPVSFTMDPSLIESAITPRTKAIMPVSLYGNPADLPAIADIARRHGLLLIEDACQAHGASIDGRRSGAWSTGVFSFYPTKNMTTGEGGIITTDNPEIAELASLLRAHGMRERYKPDMLGYNFRMTDIGASIGLAQLEKLPAANERRRSIADRYDRELTGVVTPRRRPNAEHAFHQYTLRVAQRDRFLARLAELGVGGNIYYPLPVHRQKPFLGIAGQPLLPTTEMLTDQILSIPVYPNLTDDEVDTIINAVNRTASEIGERLPVE
ncbi:MAG TPA: DegT/DnrJ/EryC1/StrS family aminotransferase [Candidatus Limnocylindria bacterium]